MEQRDINKLIRNRSLQSRSVENVTLRLQIQTLIFRHCVEWRKMDKRVQMGGNVCVMDSNGGVSIYRVGDEI
jgi:hypothetical protein